MKALIVSDSHGWREELKQVIDRHQEEVDIMIHCGDSEIEPGSPELSGVKTVKGNCDFYKDFPEEIVEETAGVRFFAGHGHLLNVKMSSLQLKYKGEESNADVICFGHSHVPTAFTEDGMVFINPGSIRLPRQVTVGTYVIADITAEKADVTFYSLEGEEVKELGETFQR
ncbi:metallophosphoesterase family protein [Alteribacter populi]|uniref:metallophosphoesterase family protein n=1 Tax=Alteribacter populi TaxID=2011011 RepID=UPI000BBB3D25|nr:metallophosphoesterase [Alteribacter populi]